MTDNTCPWCSHALPSPTPEHCPSCGAQLVAALSEDVPGVTQVDLAAVRADPIVAPPKRSLLGFISGEYQVDEPTAPQGSLAPPPDEVRREMLRMEIEAAEVEAAAIRAELEIEAAEAAEAAGTDVAESAEAGTDGEAREAEPDEVDAEKSEDNDSSS
ncbi:MAG TPA: hypothetical protein VFC71_04455 [Candidatus Polarisedimenticolia bacterium]|nr:hypothetical protein [Candidatus Polarisedimenticolia bacterium]